MIRYRYFLTALVLLCGYASIHLLGSRSSLAIICLVVAGVILATQLMSTLPGWNLRTRPGRYLVLLGGVSLLMISMTAINVITGVGRYTPSAFFNDLIAMTVLSSGYILTTLPNPRERYLRYYLSIIATVGFFAGLAALALADYSTGRQGNVSQPQYILWGFLFPWSWLLLYKTIVGDSRIVVSIVTYGSVAMYLGLGLLFGKRVVLFEFAVIALILLAVLARGIPGPFVKVMRAAVIVAAILAALQYFVPSFDLLGMFDYTRGRLLDDSVAHFDRIEEFRNMLNEYTAFTPFTGAGFGSLQSGPGGVNLHIGWLNFAFKGGLIFVAVHLWVFTLALKTLFTTNDRWVLFVSSSVVFIYFDIMIVSAWVASPITLSESVLVFALLRLVDTHSQNNQKSLSYS